MDLKKYVSRRKFSVFVMVSELLERAEERRDGTEKDFLRFSFEFLTLDDVILVVLRWILF